MSNPLTSCGKTASILALASLPHGFVMATDPPLSAHTPPHEQKRKASSMIPVSDRATATQTRGATTILSSDIKRDTTLRKEITYVVDGEVHVRTGVTLTIEDGATILIRNGYRPRRTLDTSALIFDSGSHMHARTVTFASADSAGTRVEQALNGGVFFCGSYRSGTKDGISSRHKAPESCFRADRIIADYVGRADPLLGDGNDNDRDDIDAISVIGVGTSEWRVRAVETRHSGDDGFDAYNSSIALDTLSVTNPTEDGVNLTSSTLTVRTFCSIDMTRSDAPDRELFDFEIDNGPSRINLAKESFVSLRGFWGNESDDVRLTSRDMPTPPRVGASQVPYEFNGVLKTGPARISSSTTD